MSRLNVVTSLDSDNTVEMIRHIYNSEHSIVLNNMNIQISGEVFVNNDVGVNLHFENVVFGKYHIH